MFSRDRAADTEVNLDAVEKPELEQAGQKKRPDSDVRTTRRDSDTQVDLDAFAELGISLDESSEDNNASYNADEEVRTTLRAGGDLPP